MRAALEANCRGAFTPLPKSELCEPWRQTRRSLRSVVNKWFQTRKLCTSCLRATRRSIVAAASDWRFAKKFDAYAGFTYSKVNNGLASGFLFNNSQPYSWSSIPKKLCQRDLGDRHADSSQNP
jgi:hypothetical protein